MVPLFSSSTEWWILPLCSETGTHSVTMCFFGLVIDMPVLVHVKVVVYPVVAQMQIPMVLTVQKNIEIPQLQSIDQVLDVPVAQVQFFTGAGREKSIEIPQLHSSSVWTRSFTRPLCATTDAVCFRRQKTAKVPQLQYL